MEAGTYPPGSEGGPLTVEWGNWKGHLVRLWRRNPRPQQTCTRPVPVVDRDSPVPDGAVAVLVPELGHGISEVDVLAWLVLPPSRVTAGDPLLEISTDKVDTEVPAPVTGQLHRLTAGPGDHVPVGGTLAYIVPEGG